MKLRPGVMFHDGSRLTADDVLFSLQRPARAINSPGPLTTFTRQILETKVIDNSTLHIKTREPYGGLLGDLTSLFIVSKAAAEKASPPEFDSGKAAIGTGPFRLINFEKGKEVKLERHDSYWGGPAPWQQVTLLFMPDEKQRTAALTSKQVDAIEGVPPADIPTLRAQATVQLVQRTSWRTIFLHLEQFTDRSPWIHDGQGHPVERSPLKDRRVRRAMSLALDRPAMIRTHLQGLAEPAGQLVAPGVLGYSKTLKPDSFDAVTARRLLAQAGYGEGFTLTMHGPKNRYIYDEQICHSVAEQWASVGIRTRIETMPAAQYFARARQGEFSVAMLGYGS
ncbi:MAG TPA: ABC transporter substrate-binding protein, partial [Burkholderiaceae bacterium]|nr:ABC transporter substrate-binding protein [Burkholderiaceae bacterium]